MTTPTPTRKKYCTSPLGRIYTDTMTMNETIARITRTGITLILAAGAALAAGCSSTPLNGSTYTDNQIQATGSIDEGVILQVRNVIADRSASNNNGAAASALGGVVGGVIGQAVGRGTVRALATTAGAAGGAYAAGEYARQRQRVPAWEFVVRTKSGNLVPITQEADRYPLRPGQRVYLITSGGRTRIVPAA